MELDPNRLVQSVTDLATRLVGAEFGALFHNVLNERGDSYMLYTLSGVPREAFSKFPMPRNTAIFSPPFRGESIVRSDDITKDPKYGQNPPYHGMPDGHLPVRSYPAVPVISHDLQEPLRMVSVYSQLLKKTFSGQLGEKGEEFIRYTIASVPKFDQQCA